MNRESESRAAFKQALEQRLKDEASRSGHDLGRVRTLLVFDRFLAALDSSVALVTPRGSIVSVAKNTKLCRHAVRIKANHERGAVVPEAPTEAAPRS